MRIPEFAAALSLGRTRGHYRAQGFQVVSSSNSIQPQAQCWCDEPDLRRVCTSPGHCYNKVVCLQWSCPDGGGGIDDNGGLGGYFPA
jgi:hypothetical protein